MVHGFRHAGVYNALGLLDEDDLPDYATTDESDLSDYTSDELDIDMDEVMGSSSSKLSVSDVYTDPQTGESEDTRIDDVVIIADSD